MVSYSFNNNAKIDKNYLVDLFKHDFKAELIDDTNENIVLGNSNMFIDIGKKYIIILLYDDKINIKPIKHYIMKKSYGQR